MLSYPIAIPATISTTAIMNVASLITTTEEFTEKQQLGGLIIEKGGTRSK